VVVSIEHKKLIKRGNFNEKDIIVLLEASDENRSRDGIVIPSNNQIGLWPSMVHLAEYDNPRSRNV